MVSFFFFLLFCFAGSFYISTAIVFPYREIFFFFYCFQDFFSFEVFQSLAMMCFHMKFFSFFLSGFCSVS